MLGEMHPMRSGNAVKLAFIASILVMTFLPMNTGVASQGEREEQSPGSQEAVIFEEGIGGFDEFGRPVVFRLTFEPTAGIGPEDLPTPFVAYVESGTFRYRASSGETSELAPGANVTVALGDDYSFRSLESFDEATLLVLALPGSCRVYLDNACMPHFLPYDYLCSVPCRPDVTNTPLFLDQDLRSRLWTVRFSVSRMVFPAKQPVESLDAGGASDLIRLYVRVEAGSIVTTNGDVYTAGDEFVAETDDVLLVGESGVELIVLRAGAPLNSD